jgi:predicted RNase H-like nuclease
MTIIGIDCATIAAKTGLALSEFNGGILSIKDCRIAETKIPIADQIYNWIASADRVLLAMDSPLGWPHPMGRALIKHKAGAPIAFGANDLFRRYTDEVVRKALGKLPLEVGADRIARTAVAALSLLADLGALVGKAIPLAWDAQVGKSTWAIEVYPAGTLRAYQRMGAVTDSKDSKPGKRSLVSRMKKSGTLRFESGMEKGIDNEHVLDSVLCAISAVDFLEKRAIAPRTDKERNLARKEGWIWVRDTSGKSPTRHSFPSWSN